MYQFSVLSTTYPNAFLFYTHQLGEKRVKDVDTSTVKGYKREQTCHRRFARGQGRASQLWPKKWRVLFTLHLVHKFITRIIKRRWIRNLGSPPVFLGRFKQTPAKVFHNKYKPKLKGDYCRTNSYKRQLSRSKSVNPQNNLQI